MKSISNNKPVAIVLGGTLPHILLIKNLQKRGYHTILVDYYENPAAKHVADEHLQESTLDLEAVLDIAQNKNAKLVISTCIDQANVTACYVAEKLGLPAPYSYKTALDVTNKGLMKEKLSGNGIPTAKYVFINDISDFESAGLIFPVIVKPADSNSSKGVQKASDYDELRKHLKTALEISRCNEAIIEEYKEGKEIGIDCFVKNKEATVLMVKERRKILVHENDNPVQQIYGCLWPENLTKKNYTNLKQIAEKIARAFNLNNTPLMIQAIVNDDEINVIEFGARIGGGESFRIIKLSTGFDFVDAAVDSFLGNNVTLDFDFPQSYYSDNFIYAKQGVFGSVSGYETVLENGTIEYLDTFRTKGTEIGPEMSSNNRVGVFVVKSDNKKELFEKINTALKNIEVYDVDGKPIMRKDIYCFE